MVVNARIGRGKVTFMLGWQRDANYIKLGVIE